MATTQGAADRMIEAGIKAQQAGDALAARASYGRALESDPENAEALHLLGVLEAQAGDLAAAAALMERAVAADPGEPLFRINLAGAYAKLSDFKRAADMMRRAVLLAPDDQKLRFDLGLFEYNAGNFQAALDIFEPLTRANWKNAEILRRFGDAALFAGDAEKTIAAANRLQEVSPTTSDGVRLACGARTLERNWADVAHLAKGWTERFPKEPNAWKTLSSALYELGRRDQAKLAFDPVLELEPDVPANRVIRNTLARYATELGDAAGQLERALNEEIKSAQEAAALAILGIHCGQFAEAERLALRAIELDPDDVRGYIHYSTLKDGKVSDAQLAVLEKVNAGGRFEPYLGGRLSFTLGTIYEARQDYERAFKAFREGNDRKHAVALGEGGGFKFDEEQKRTETFIRFFAKGVKPLGYPKGAAVPIFVVGMPRSGTTLVESLLAAHPDVFGAGELLTLNDVHLEVARWASANAGKSPSDAPDSLLRQWRDQYFAGYPDFGGAKYVIDKQPANHQSLGLIPLLFPEARIIHMRRSPVETCFSIWRRDFPKGWTYANRLEDLGLRYGEYARLTTHWEKVLGPEYLLVQYESLIDDFEGWARRIAAHCGLAFREEMLEFHTQKRVVLTFSATQVRKPVYRDAIDKSRLYGSLLDPLRLSLERAQVDLKTGAWSGA